MNEPPSEDGPFSFAALAVRALLDRHGIAKHRHSSFVGDFFGLSRGAAHQRVNRSAAWTLEELQALSDHFGEQLADVVTSHGPDDARPATLRIGGVQAACRVWLDRTRPRAATDTLVAIESGGALLVVPATAASPQSSVRVVRLDLEQAASMPARVAVLDDENDVVNAICDQLRSAGLEAVGYTTSKKLMTDLARKPYDGYVVDWSLSDGNAIPLLAMIRGQPTPSAIVLLSGKMRSDPIEVAAACSAYRLQLVEKPAPLPMILSALELNGLRPSSLSALE